MKIKPSNWLKNLWRKPAEISAIKVSRSSAPEFPDRPRILVLKLDHIGDFVLAMRAFAELRTAWPNAAITLICGPWNRRLAEQTGFFGRIVEYSFFPENASDLEPPTSAIYSQFSQIDIGGPYDIAIDMRRDRDTRPLLAMVDAKFRAGYTASNINFPLDIELPQPLISAKRSGRSSNPLNAELQMLVLIAALINYFRQREPHPIDKMFGATADKAATAGRGSIVISPGAGKTISQWPLANFVALCKILIERTTHNIVIVGNQRDTEKARIISAAQTPDRVSDLTGKLPIDELPGLLSKAALFIGNDSGATHLAAKLGTPTICIFSGAADYRIWRPIGPNVKIIRAEIECSPCNFMKREDCPFGVKCLTAISVDEVLGATLGMLPASRRE